MLSDMFCKGISREHSIFLCKFKGKWQNLVQNTSLSFSAGISAIRPNAEERNGAIYNPLSHYSYS